MPLQRPITGRPAPDIHKTCG